MIRSRALEVNIADYHVDVEIDPKYTVLQEIMSSYYGLREGLTTFLKELSHPYKNWHFIVREARIYSLDYFHLIKAHAQGPDAAGLYIDIYLRAIESTRGTDVCIDAVDNLMLFLMKVVKESGAAFDRFAVVLDGAFQSIRRYDHPIFMLFLKSYYQLNRLAEAALANGEASLERMPHLNLLMIQFYQESYAYWLQEDDPQQWFEKEVGEFKPDGDLGGVFEAISHHTFQRYNTVLDEILHCEDIRAPAVLRRLLAMPGFNQIVQVHRDVPGRLGALGKQSGRGDLYRLLFLFYQMNLAGLSIIHEEALRDINRTLTWIIENEKPWHIRSLIEKTFSILKARAAVFPTTALNCVLNMGKGVYRTQNIDFINFFIDQVIDLGFQTPNIGGVGNDWQIQVNSAHLQNIRTWLELIELSPKRSTRLMSYLIIHISISSRIQTFFRGTLRDFSTAASGRSTTSPSSWHGSFPSISTISGPKANCGTFPPSWTKSTTARTSCCISCASSAMWKAATASSTSWRPCSTSGKPGTANRCGRTSRRIFTAKSALRGPMWTASISPCSGSGNAVSAISRRC